MNYNRVHLFIFVLFLFALPTTAFGAQMTVTDDLGRTLNLPASPTRIVSLEPSVTEILYAVGAEKNVVAVDDYSDYPPTAQLKPHVNGIGPSQEMVIGLRPDLIILYDQTFTRAKADLWSVRYGVPVYVLAGRTYQEIEADIAKVGQLAGDPQKTSRLLNNMDNALQTVTRAVKNRPKVTAFVVVWDHPLMTAGRGSYFDNLITLAGGIDVASSTAVGYPTFSPERLVADQPQYILTGTIGSTVIPSVDSGLSGLNLAANTKGRSFAIPDDWTARPGPRLALGLVAIAHVLHPEAFTKIR